MAASFIASVVVRENVSCMERASKVKLDLYRTFSKEVYRIHQFLLNMCMCIKYVLFYPEFPDGVRVFICWFKFLVSLLKTTSQ